MHWEYYITLLIVGLILYYKTNISGKHTLLGLSFILLGLFNWQASLAVMILTSLTFFCQKNRLYAWLAILVHLTGLMCTNYFMNHGLFFKLGLSYYALQNIGVLLLVIRDKPQSFKFLDLAFANAFFAKFVSGPILLPKEIKQYKIKNHFFKEMIFGGINRILFGLFKKIVLADNLSVITSTVFNHPESDFKAITVIIAALLFTIEMYLNFSAYTDIALGVSKLFNVKLKENFNLPLRSRSVTEYWRKTHISLIEWFTQNFFYYLTFKGRSAPISSAIIGILATFILSGLWHGTEIGFLIWGGLNAIYLIFEFLIRKKKIRLPKLVGWILTVLLISFANLFFISKHWSNASNFISNSFSSNAWDFKWDEHIIAILGNGGYLEQQFHLGLVIGLVLLFLLIERKIEYLAKSNKTSLLFLSILGILIFAFGNFNDGSDFIYMQF